VGAINHLRQYGRPTALSTWSGTDRKDTDDNYDRRLKLDSMR